MLNINPTEVFRQECIEYGYLLKTSEVARMYEVSVQTIHNNPELFKRGERGFKPSELPEVIEGYTLKQACEMLNRSVPSIMEYIKAGDIKARQNCLNKWRLDRNDTDKLRGVLRLLPTGQRYKPGGGHDCRVKTQCRGYAESANYLKVKPEDVQQWVKQGLPHTKHRFKMSDLDAWKAKVDKARDKNILQLICSGKFNKQIMENGKNNMMFRKLLMQESVQLIQAGEFDNEITDYLVERPRLRELIKHKISQIND